MWSRWSSAMPSLAMTSQIAGADRNHLCGSRFPGSGSRRCRRPGAQRNGCEYRWHVLGDQVGGDVSDPGPVRLAGREIDARQGHRGPSGAGQHAVAELDQDFDPLAAARRCERFHGAQCRVRGSRAVTESVDHAEQSSLTIDADRDRLVTADVLAGRGRPAVAHSIGPEAALSCTGRNPFPHFDDRSAPECGFHDQPVHQAAGTGQARDPAHDRSSIRPPSRARCRRCPGPSSSARTTRALRPSRSATGTRTAPRPA